MQQFKSVNPAAKRTFLATRKPRMGAMTNLSLSELNQKLFLNIESFLHQFGDIQDLTTDNLGSAGNPTDVLVDQIGEGDDGGIERRIGSVGAAGL